MISILVLEDEPFIALDIQFALRDAGALPYLAATCDQALAAVAQHEIAAAILDVNLGHGKTCEEVALELSRRGTPFLLHTADLDRSGEFLRKFDVPIVAKPAAADTVAHTVLSLIGPR